MLAQVLSNVGFERAWEMGSIFRKSKLNDKIEEGHLCLPPVFHITYSSDELWGDLIDACSPYLLRSDVEYLPHKLHSTLRACLKDFKCQEGCLITLLQRILYYASQDF